MLYLLDANVLIRADREYYPLDRVPQFWDWILDKANTGNVKIPYEILDEIIEGHPDDLVKWVKNNKTILRLDEEVDPRLLREVTYEGYKSDLTDTDTHKIGKDAFLIAYARVATDRCVVTLERSKPSSKGSNRKIPDVCNAFNVKHCDTFQLIRDLDFKIP